MNLFGCWCYGFAAYLACQDGLHMNFFAALFVGALVCIGTTALTAKEDA